MSSSDITQIREQLSNSAHAISFLIAASLVLIVWGVLQLSIPSFLLTGIFVYAVSRELPLYRKTLEKFASVTVQSENSQEKIHQ